MHPDAHTYTELEPQDLDPGYHNCKSEGAIPGAAANTGNFQSYKNDAEDTAALGFDGVKFDAGGGNDNMTLWAQAVNATGRVMMLENCNNGGDVPYGLRNGKGHDQGCPFNMFRTGIDNSPSPLSMISNLLDTSRYLNVSRPGCYAYPVSVKLILCSASELFANCPFPFNGTAACQRV
eukprot:SAG31_NODE_1600_length_7791_cov_15.201508_6_plen_178_part_00